jgi:hypothetical protein
VVLVDSARKPGAKILVSGGSRCNVTNTVVTERDFWGGRPAVIRKVLRAFPVGDTIAFFREIGVSLHEEAGGKLFPDTNRARDVLDALLRESAAAGASLVPGHRVLDVERSDAGFRVATEGGELRAAAVVLATGGQSLPKSGSDGAGFAIAKRLGHTIVPTTPALAPLVLGEPSIHIALSGVAHDVELSVWVDARVRSPPDGRVAVDAFRRQRTGGDERVASLAAGAARAPGRLDHPQPPPRKQFDDVDAEWQQLASVNAESRGADRRSPRWSPHRSPRRRCNISGWTAPSRWRISGGTIGAGSRGRWSNGCCRSSIRAATTSPKRQPAASR